MFDHPGKFEDEIDILIKKVEYLKKYSTGLYLGQHWEGSVHKDLNEVESELKNADRLLKSIRQNL